MRLFFAVISLLFFTFEASANFNRETTFEDRSICELDNRGVWREFGDVCVDNCESKFDQFKICDRAIQFSCDCGVSRCWRDKKCILISDYQKTYEANLQKRQEKIAEEKKDREFEAKENAKIITNKLIDEVGNRATSFDIEGAANNYSDFYHKTVNDVMDSQTMKNASNSLKNGANKIKNEEIIPLPQAPPIVIESKGAEPTPFFLQQEELKKQKNNEQNQSLTPTLETLPMIPLPQ